MELPQDLKNFSAGSWLQPSEDRSEVVRLMDLLLFICAPLGTVAVLALIGSVFGS